MKTRIAYFFAFMVCAALFGGLALVVRQVTTTEANAVKAKDAPTLSVRQEPEYVTAEGRVVPYPGAEVTVASELAGTLEKFACTEKHSVRRGETIAVLKADDMRASVAEARARVAEAEADIRLARTEVQRSNDLWARHFIGRQAVDRAEQSLDAALARRENANASVHRLEAMLAKTVITAPIGGTIIARHANQGETVNAGNALCTIADLSKLRLEAEVDEFDSGRVRLGAEVSVKAEGYDGRAWRGRVEEIPDAVTQRRMRPQDPAHPTDTRVLPVKIALLEAVPLKLRQRVEVKIMAARHETQDVKGRDLSLDKGP
jgi:HlyD family secretion protein